MEMQQLRCFVAVATEKHFGRAAKQLHMAQPGVSHQINRLEVQLGVRLFTRTTRRVSLTDAGNALLPEAQRILSAVSVAESTVGQVARGEVGRLKVGFVASASLAIVPRLAQAISEQWPGLTLQLNEMTTGTQLELLTRGDIDIGIGRELGRETGFTTRPLVRERLYAAVHDSHRVATHQSIPLAELAGERFVAFPRQQVSLLYDHIAKLCEMAGFQLTVAEEAVQFMTILGLVAGGTGVAIVPEPLRALRLPGLRFIVLEDEFATSLVSLVHRPDQSGSSIVTRFLEIVEQSFPVPE